MSEVSVININNPFQDQKPGTSGLNDSGSGIVKNRSFWLVADAELIVMELQSLLQN